MKALLLACTAFFALQAQPRAESFVLPNGLRVILLENHELPLLRAHLAFALEPADTPPGLQGLPLLMMQVLGASDVGSLKAQDYDRLLEAAGIQLTQTLTATGPEWRLVARSRNQDRALGLLAERLLHAVIDPPLLESQRKNLLRNLERPEAPADERLALALRQPAASRPTKTSLGGLTLEDLLACRARVLRPDRAVLVLHGDLGLEQAKRLVLLNLGAWAPPQAPPLRLPAKDLGGAEGPVFIPAPTAGLRIQALAVPPGDLPPEALALLGLLVPGDPLLAPVRVAFQASALIATLDEGGLAPTPAASWSLLHQRLEALRLRGFTQAELDLARNVWLARRSVEALHPESLLEAALAEVRGRGVALDRMKGLSLDALNAHLRRWLEPAGIRRGATGNPESLKQLAQSLSGN